MWQTCCCCRPLGAVDGSSGEEQGQALKQALNPIYTRLNIIMKKITKEGHFQLSWYVCIFLLIPAIRNKYFKMIPAIRKHLVLYQIWRILTNHQYNCELPIWVPYSWREFKYILHYKSINLCCSLVEYHTQDDLGVTLPAWEVQRWRCSKPNMPFPQSWCRHLFSQ